MITFFQHNLLKASNIDGCLKLIDRVVKEEASEQELGPCGVDGDTSMADWRACTTQESL